MDYIKIKLFKIKVKILKVIYKLDLLAKIKIHLIYYIIIVKLAYRDLKLLIYKVNIYKRQEENK